MIAALFQGSPVTDLREIMDVIAVIVGIIAMIRFWKAEAAARRAQIAAENDLKWRVTNLEVWRKEHQIDADSRDILLRNSDIMITQLKTLVESDRKRHH